MKEGAASSAGIKAPEPKALQATTTPLSENQLSEDDQAEVSKLKARDQEVRTHEEAHRSAGQGYTRAAHFDYVRGPDDRRYAVGGHVQIDTSKVPDNPEATIAKMEVVRRAALAPARPSGQDRAVAAQAAASIQEAEAELAKRAKETDGAADGEGQQARQPIDILA